MPLDPTRVYRWFRNHPNDLAKVDESTKRLASSLFRNKAMSVDDGAICTPEDTARRNPACRVAALLKSDIQALGLRIEAKPEASNPAHAEILGIARSDQAKSLRERAVIVIGLPGVVVVNPRRPGLVALRCNTAERQQRSALRWLHSVRARAQMVGSVGSNPPSHNSGLGTTQEGAPTPYRAIGSLQTNNARPDDGP